MRFGDGAWRMLDGVTPYYVSRVDESEHDGRGSTLHVTSKLDTSRGGTLEGPTFRVRITTPLPNVFRIVVEHHLGRPRRGPSFEIPAEPRELEAREGDDSITLRSGALEVIANKSPWSLTFRDAEADRALTSSPFKAQGLMHVEGFGEFMREQLTLSVGEVIYGLGERFQAFARNGQSIDTWNADCGTCSDKAYKNVPFFLSSRGYGVLVNTPARVSFEIGTEQVTRSQFGVPGHVLDYFLILGPTPKQVLSRLGALSGRPALPPAWSFGLWLTTSFTTDYDEATVNHFINGMAERNLPLHVFHFDCFWMKAHHWCDFRWDEAVFPDPPGMLARLHERGLAVCVWINPYIAERAHLFEEGMLRGYLLKRPDGSVWQRDRWQAGMAYVDFTNPDATRWYQAQLERLLDMGVDCFKTDFGEEIPTDVVYHDGSDPELMHNYYTFLYNRAVFEVLERKRGAGQACLFARSATATCQQFPVHWGGDCYGTYESMAESLRGGLSLGLSGFGFWSHDIGGFENRSSAAVYKRWLAFGLLSSHSRLHGSTSYRVPWSYDDEACDVLRHFTHLKCRLMPYLMTCAVEAHEHSIPVMRAMLLEFPDDRTCLGLDTQYLLGPNLLVAPVFDDELAECYLPAGEWTHLLSGEVRSGPLWHSQRQSFFEVPLWVRPNGVVAVGPEVQRVDYDLEDNVRLVCGKLDGRSKLRVRLHDQSGGRPCDFEIYQEPGRLRVSSSALSDFQVQLPWASELDGVERGSAVHSDLRSPVTGSGVIVRSSGGTASFSYRA